MIGEGMPGQPKTTDVFVCCVSHICLLCHLFFTRKGTSFFLLHCNFWVAFPSLRRTLAAHSLRSLVS